MRLSRIVISAAFAAGLAALPLSTAKAQGYQPPSYPACSPFPLFWPFCIVGAVVVGAATLVTAPFWLLAGAPPPYFGYYGPPPYYPPPGYYPPPRYFPPQGYYPPGYYAPGSSAPSPPSGQH
jgi:hypothetical protein